MLSLVGLYDILHIDATIEEFTRNRLFFTFRYNISMHIADSGKPDEHTCAVLVSQTALDVIFPVQSRIDVIHFSDIFRPRLEPFFIYSCLV